MYHKAINQHSFPVANHEKRNSSLETTEAQTQYCFSASKQDSKQSPQKQEKNLSKRALIAGVQIKWGKAYVFYLKQTMPCLDILY